MLVGFAIDDGNKTHSLEAGHAADLQLFKDRWHKIDEFDQGLVGLYLPSALLPRRTIKGARTADSHMECFSNRP